MLGSKLLCNPLTTTFDAKHTAAGIWRGSGWHMSRRCACSDLDTDAMVVTKLLLKYAKRAILVQSMNLPDL